jgi:hypothetical protein
MPGIGNSTSITHRNIFTTVGSLTERYVPSLFILDGKLSRDTGCSQPSLLRAGLVVGKNSSTGKYRPTIIGVTHAAALSNATSLTVVAPVATEIARLITANGGSAVSLTLVGPPTTAGTVATLTATCSAASGTTLTVSSLSAALAAGSYICPADGSQQPMTILTNPYGQDVVDVVYQSIDQALQSFLTGADIIASQVVNMLADDFGQAVDASVTTWLKTHLRDYGYSFTFDNDRK